LSSRIHGNLLGIILLAIFVAVIGVAITILAIGPNITPAGTHVSLVYFFHPVFSIPSVLLVVTAYLFKRWKKERFLAHYLAGTMAVSFSIIAALLGLGVVDHHASTFLFTVNFHLLIAIAVLVTVLVHGTFGMQMLLFGRTPRRISRHKKLAKWVLILYLVQGSLGLTILSALLIFGLF
jgi:hypothetical protein